jgi:hypothetical protein
MAIEDRHRDRGRGIVAGAWLIGLGLVFVIHDSAGLSWGEAWPLFIVVGAAVSLVRSLVNRDRLRVGAWSLAWPVAWIVVGLILFAATTGRIETAPAEILTGWWPILLVGIGVWFLVAAVWPGRTPASETLTIPLAGAQSASVRVSFGGGDLVVRRGPPGALVAGTFQGGVVYRSPAPGQLELKPDTGGGWPMSGRGFHWDVGLTGEVPLDLRLDTGASRSTIDLYDLLVRRLDLHSGASDTRIRLPAAAGVTAVRTQTGVASLTIEIPPGVGARIRSGMAMGRLIVDESRFPRTSGGFESPGLPAAPNRVDIDVQGGVGSVTIR